MDLQIDHPSNTSIVADVMYCCGVLKREKHKSYRRLSAPHVPLTTHFSYLLYTMSKKTVKIVLS